MKMKHLFHGNNKCSKSTPGLLIGVIFASLMCSVIIFFEKGLVDNLVWYYFLIFCNGLPLVVLSQFKLPSNVIYPLTYVYFVTLSLIVGSIKLRKKYWFFIIILLIHLISAIYYHLYLKNLVKPFIEIIERFF